MRLSANYGKRKKMASGYHSSSTVLMRNGQRRKSRTSFIGLNGTLGRKHKVTLLLIACATIGHIQTETLATARAEQGRLLGVDGLVCSPEEAANVRSVAGADMVLVTPGIRPAGAAAGDQKRIMTSAAAIAAGADYLVVGRPIVAASDPRTAAEAIVAEIARETAEEKRNGQGVLDRPRRRAQ